jgi:hypothetical protein
MHQKQPPAKVAFSATVAAVAGGISCRDIKMAESKKMKRVTLFMVTTST